MSQNQNRDSSRRQDSVFDELTSSEADPLRDITVGELVGLRDLFEEQHGPLITLEDWSNPKLGVPVLLVRRAEIPYVD